MPAISKGDLVLVTGASGLIAGAIIDLLIERGFRVRGTTRSAAKAQWMSSHYGPNFSLVEVPDIAADHAFDEAVKGVDGIAVVATPTSFSSDPNEAIPVPVNGILRILEAAKKEPRVKSIVFTSSTAAVSLPKPGVSYLVDQNTFNDEAVEQAWKPADGPSLMQGFIVYSAAKTTAEKKAFEWVKQHKPHFSFNTVIPPLNIGKQSSPKNTGFTSTVGFLHAIFYGDPALTQIPATQYVDVEDDALLHIAALTQPDVDNERIFAIAENFSWREILGILRKLYPERKFLDNVEEPEHDGCKFDPALKPRAEELLRRMGKDGFTGLEDAVRKSTELFLKYENDPDMPKSSSDVLMTSLSVPP
jgi:nucleoside-diphosphate-sugar epimerase